MLKTGYVVLMDRPGAAVGLPGVLAELRTRAGLSRRQLEELSSVSEETIKAVESGRNLRPLPDTLRKLAQGLATNRVIGRVDQAAAVEIHTRLMQAARYLAPAPTAEQGEDDDAMLRRQIERKVGPLHAPLGEALLDALTEAPTMVDQDTILNVVRVLTRRPNPPTDR